MTEHAWLKYRTLSHHAAVKLSPSAPGSTRLQTSNKAYYKPTVHGTGQSNRDNSSLQLLCVACFAIHRLRIHSCWSKNDTAILASENILLLINSAESICTIYST